MNTLKFLVFLLAVTITGSAFILSQDDKGYEIGDTATDFSLKDVDGDMVSLSDYPDAQGYIVIFTCNSCPFAQANEDRIIALHEKYAPDGYPVIAINPNDPDVQAADSYENMQKRAEKKDFPFPYVIDKGQKIYPQYGASRTPHVFLLDADRKVRYIGAIDDNTRNPEAVEEKYVENAIAALEKGKDPDPAITKAIGCKIKKK